MSKLNKFVAVMMSATLIVGSGITAFAEDVPATAGTGVDISGTGTNEGHLDDEIYDVVLPTVPESGTASVYQYLMDPERIVRRSNGIRYGENGIKLPEETEEVPDAGVYFATAADNTTLDYDYESQKQRVINKSSTAIKLTVSHKLVAGGTSTDVPVAATKAAALSAEVPTLYLGIKVGKTDAAVPMAVSETAGTIDKVLDGNAENYKIVWDTDHYKLQKKADPTGAWKAIDVSVEGAVTSGKKLATTVTTTPTVNIKWTWAKANLNAETNPDVKTPDTELESVTETPANAAPSITRASVTGAEDTDAVWTYSLGAGDDAATAISSIKFNGADATSAFVLTTQGQIKLPSATVNSLLASPGSYSYTVTFDDEAGTTGTITLVISE